MMKLSTIAPLMAATLLFVTAEAFTPASRSAIRLPSTLGRNSVQLRSSEDDEVSSLPTLPSQGGSAPKVEAVAPASAPVATINDNAVAEEEELQAYPINLPSPILLGTSMILAISSIGSLYEITGGGPTKLGFGPTLALAAIGLPLSVFFIYAAILKGAAETEEDDAEYNTPRKL